MCTEPGKQKEVGFPSSGVADLQPGKVSVDSRKGEVGDTLFLVRMVGLIRFVCLPVGMGTRSFRSSMRSDV